MGERIFPKLAFSLRCLTEVDTEDTEVDTMEDILVDQMTAITTIIMVIQYIQVARRVAVALV